MRWNLPKLAGAATCAAALTLATAASAQNGSGGDGNTVTAAYISGTITLDPADPAWDSAPNTTLGFNKFIDYVETGSCIGDPTGRSVSVQAVHNGSRIFFRFEWADATHDAGVGDTPAFADAIAASIPYSGNAPIDMGNQNNPVNLLLWRAGRDAPQNLVAGGIGTPQPSPDAQNLEQYQDWSNEAWTVIVSRPLTSASDNQVDLNRGGEYPLAVASWDGSNQERNGRKVITGWKTLAVQ